MKKRITITLCTAALCSVLNLKAQHGIGLGAGNHNAPYSAFVNPAQTYPDKNRLYINLWGMQAGFTNNFLTWQAPFGIWRASSGNYPDLYQKPGGGLQFNQDWIGLDAGEKNKFYYLNKVYGPSAFFRVENDLALGFGVNGVNGLSADGISEEAAYLLRYGLDTAGMAFRGAGAPEVGQSYSNGKFSINTDKWQEWFFSMAGTTGDNKNSVLKWGASAKILLGMGGAGVRADGFNYTVSTQNQLIFSADNASMYHTENLNAMGESDHPLGLKFGMPMGAGLGLDAGFIYEYRPQIKRVRTYDGWCFDDYRSDYLWKFGASITDAGFLSYRGVKNTLNNQSDKSWTIQQDVFKNQSLNPGLNDALKSLDDGFFRDTAVNAGFNDRYMVSTPLAFNAQFDLSPANNFYVGLQWQQNLKSQASRGLKNTSFLSLIPRYETEHAEVSVPITLTRDYTTLNMGLYGRLGPVIAGTDNLAGLAGYIAGNPTKNANVYFGVRLQIPACGWFYDEEYHFDTTVIDTTYSTDTVTFWKVDTVYREKLVRDTIRIETVDTIVLNRVQSDDADLTLKSLELKKKEDEIKKREEALIAREKAFAEKEKTSATPAECQEKIKSLEEQLKRERDQYARLNEQNQLNKAEKEKAEKRIAELEKELAVVKAENDGLKNENSVRQADILRLQQEVQRLKAGNIPCSAQVKTLDSLLLIEQKRNQEILTEKSKQSAEIVTLKSENESLKKRIAELEKDKVAIQAALDAEKNKTRTLEEQLKNSTGSAEIEGLKAELEAQKKKCDELALKLQAAENEKAKLQSENTELKNRVAALEKDLVNLNNSLSEARAKIADLETALKNCSSGDSESMKAEIELLKKQNSEKDAIISGLKSDKAKLEEELSNAKAKISELEAKLLACSEKDCSETEAELAEWKAKYENKLSQYNALYEEYQMIVDERSTLKAKVADLEAKLKNCSGSSEEVEKLKDEVSKLKITITELNGQLDGKQRSLDDLQEEYDKVSAEKTALQKQVTQLQSQVKSLQERIAQLEDELKKCQEGVKPEGGEE